MCSVKLTLQCKISRIVQSPKRFKRHFGCSLKWCSPRKSWQGTFYSFFHLFAVSRSPSQPVISSPPRTSLGTGPAPTTALPASTTALPASTMAMPLPSARPGGKDPTTQHPNSPWTDASSRPYHCMSLDTLTILPLRSSFTSRSYSTHG